MNYFNSTVLVEPTNICNLKCIMCEAKCTVEAGINEAEYLLPEQFEIILNKLDGHITNVVFQGDCEPTLSPYLEELVKCAKKHTEQIAIVTNGTALTQERIENLIEAGVTWFALSIDDYREDKYNQIRKYSDFRRLIRNLDYLIKVRNEKYPYLYLVTHKIVFHEDSTEDLLNYINYFYIKKGVNKITFAPLVESGSIEEKEWIVRRNLLENELIKKNIHINLKDFANCPYMSNYKYCGTALYFINHNGDFAPCGLHTRDHKIFGNLIEEELDDIKSKEIFNDFHEYWYNRNFLDTPPLICKDCYLLKSPYFRYCLDDSYQNAQNIFERNCVKE